MPFDLLWLALDKSMRRYTEDGHLHVAVSHLTKATINPYKGSEIPGFDQLGIDPNRTYQLLRDPAELEKATPTFNNLQILDQHIPVTAADAAPDHIIGSTGSHATWNAPYIDNSLVFWTDAAITAIEHGSMQELSSAYRYRPDMTPGTYQGRNYDGVMRDIRANHVALVEAGRAGSDVVVMDSKPKEMEMPMTALGGYLAGSATAYIKPLLAQDSKFKFKDVPPLFRGVTAKNWQSKRASIEAALMRQIKPHLATDAEIHIHEHMDGAGATAGSMGDEGEVIPPLDNTPGAGVAETPVTDQDDDVEAQLRQLLQGCDPAVVEQVVQLFASTGAHEHEAPPGGTEPEAPATDNAESIEKPGIAKQPELAGDRKAPMDLKVAMDEAVKRAVAQTTERLNARDEAKQFVRPIVGDIAVAMDSAEEVYKFALEHLGLRTDVHPSAYRAMLEMAPKPADTSQPRSLAMDASGAKKYLERFPNANRLSARH
jgi:hypothetical protein